MALIGKFWMKICHIKQMGMIANLGSQNMDDNLSKGIVSILDKWGGMKNILDWNDWWKSSIDGWKTSWMERTDANPSRQEGRDEKLLG
jgi:hypothetical protein